MRRVPAVVNSLGFPVIFLRISCTALGLSFFAIRSVSLRRREDGERAGTKGVVIVSSILTASLGVLGKPTFRRYDAGATSFMPRVRCPAVLELPS